MMSDFWWCIAMHTVGATKYNLKPTGYGVNRITPDAFADEA